MTKRIIAYIFLAFCMHIAVNAQNADKAESIITSVQKKIESYNPFSVSADINGENALLTIKGNSFKMVNNSFIIWYNGKDQWTYIKESGEVNITSPDNSELGSVNPYHFLKNWKKTCTCRLTGEKNFNGKACRVVELKTKSKDSFDSIRLFVTPSYEIAGMTIKDVNGTEFNVKVKEIRKNINIKESFFSFDKKECPNAEIVDLR